tara:strand:+ start:5565 stop:6032 length:468 start_codon:yes stop_codon:yes gene_type:complete
MKLDAFRKIIREEVRSVIKEELSLLMQSPITETKTVKKPVIEQKITQPSFSEMINEEVLSQPTPPVLKSTGNPLLDMLNETAAAGEWRSINGEGFNSSHAAGFAGGMPGAPVRVVETVDQMLAGKQGATDLNSIVIDAVPDFSGVMSKLKDSGKL